MNKTRSILFKILMLLLGVALAVGGWLLARQGFQSIQELRQIERLPATTIAAAIPGEIKLNARVKPDQATIDSEHFRVKSVYYRYLYEEERTDSDGDRYWATIFDHRDGVDFLVEDDTGSVLLELNHSLDNRLDISLPVSNQTTSGSSRHTEWRIETAQVPRILVLISRVIICQSFPGMVKQKKNRTWGSLSF